MTLDGRLNLREAAIATLHQVLTRDGKRAVRMDAIQPRPTAARHPHHGQHDVGKRRANSGVILLHALSVISDGARIRFVGIVPLFNQTFWAYSQPRKESLFRVHYPQEERL